MPDYDNRKCVSETNLTGEEKENYHQKEKYSQLASDLVSYENNQRRCLKYPELKDFELLEKMGEGAFSIVHKALHISTDKLVAIKIIRKYQMERSQQGSVLKEVAIMRQLHHPGIVEYEGFIDSPEHFYIIQELAAGGEIFNEIVKYTYFSENLARHVIVQVADAVRYLHEEIGVVHRDIKPENLLFEPIDYIPSARPHLRKSDDPATKVDEGLFRFGLGGGGVGRVKLADFGLSKQIWETNTKTPCGTVGYTAPEIVRDQRYSKEVDMWALGCVLYTLLCGFPPFYDERIEALTEKVARGYFTFLSPWWDEISDEAKYCVSRLLTVDPRRRYTIVEFLQDPWIVSFVKNCEKHRELASVKRPAIPRSFTATQSPALYSPAAVAMRDAFDVSVAVHRMGEEAALNRMGANLNPLMEEEEDTERMQIPTNDFFDLNMKGSSLLERRQKKKSPLAVS